MFIPLSFVDDCNSVRVGDKKTLDRCLGEAAKDWGMEWDKDKEWKDGMHLGVNLARRKYRT